MTKAEFELIAGKRELRTVRGDVIGEGHSVGGAPCLQPAQRDPHPVNVCGTEDWPAGQLVRVDGSAAGGWGQ